jgi:hypothetical protein
VTLRWDDIDLATGRLHVRRAKSGDTSVHPISARESRALRKLLRAKPQRPNSRGVPMPRAVLLGGLDEALDLPVGEIYSRLRWPTVTFTEVGAASRSREFSMEIALPPVRTVTDWEERVTDLDGCSSPAESAANVCFWGFGAHILILHAFSTLLTCYPHTNPPGRICWPIALQTAKPPADPAVQSIELLSS